MTEPNGRAASELTGARKFHSSSTGASGTSSSVAAAPSAVSAPAPPSMANLGATVDQPTSSGALQKATSSAPSARSPHAAARAAVVSKEEEAAAAAVTELRKATEAKPLTLLQRVTQQPSPVTIPPNSISLHYLHAFLTQEECTHLLELSHGHFSRSTTYSGISASRTSHSASLSRYNPVVAAVRQRVMELTGTKSSRCIRGPSVVRYEPGQQFKPHFDSLLDFAAHKCLREFTVFVYLNTLAPDAGGETEFTKIGVKFTPKAGDALFWRNHKDRHSPHLLDGLHAGRPPRSGIKHGLNIFVTFE